MASDYKLDLFFVLKELDRGNLHVHEGLAEDPVILKEFEKNVGWLIAQWMSGAVDDKEHRRLLVAFNEVCNVGWLGFYRHPMLQAKLLACCGSGRTVKHKFFKRATAKASSLVRQLLELRYDDITDEEIRLWCRLNDAAAVTKLAEDYGYQPKDKKAVVEEFLRR